MAKTTSRAGTRAAGTKAPTEEVAGDPSGDPSGDPTGEALATPLIGEARAAMLARLADALPQSERAGFLARVEQRFGAEGGVSGDDAGEVLGEFMAERLGVLVGRVDELEDDVAALKEGAKEGAKAGDAGLSGSLVDLVVGAVRTRCAEAIALPCITGEMADANPAAGLDEMTADELVALVDTIGDPVARVAAVTAPVHTVAAEVRALAVDPQRVVNEALDNIRRHHEHAYRYWLRRKTLAEALLAKRAEVAAG